jgi:hypothetical protein
VKGLFQRIGSTIVPASEDGREALYAIQDGARFVIDIRASRNCRQHALFWALCQVLADNHDVYDTKEKAKRGLLIATGNVVTWMDHLGILHIDPRSIAFENMEQAEFNAFFQLAVAKICEWLGNAPDEIRKRVAEMTDPIKGATIPNKPEPRRYVDSAEGDLQREIDRIDAIGSQREDAELPCKSGEIVDPETGEILSPPPIDVTTGERVLPIPPRRQIVEAVTPPQGPIKWKALAQGLCECKTMEEAQDRAKRFWKFSGGWPPPEPADETKAKMINSIAKRHITGEITIIMARTEMDKILT